MCLEKEKGRDVERGMESEGDRQRDREIETQR
jgi:hypothetical protein